MKATQVKNPVPVHFSRKYDEEEIKELIDEFEAALREKTEVDIG